MRFLDAIFGRRVDNTPIWVMRQAGRYLPEYLKLREKYDFITMCKSPKIAQEATLQPIRRFDFDGAVIFSDILILVEAMGIEVKFIPSPKILNPIRTIHDVERLFVPKIDKDLHFVLETIKGVRESLDKDKVVIGFAGSPFTLACYMVEGETSKDFIHIRSLAYREPLILDMILEKISIAVSSFLLKQIESGADVIQLFDTWAGILPPSEYRRFALPYAKKVIDAVHRHSHAPVIYFVNGCAGILSDIPNTGADCISLDYRVDLEEAIKKLPPNISIQGNMDPAILLSDEKQVREKAREIVMIGMKSHGHIFNLGHGILSNTPLEHVYALVDEVRKTGKR